MDAYAEGRMAWHADAPRNECPYNDSVQEYRDRRQWLAGWDEEARDNSQFGVCA